MFRLPAREICLNALEDVYRTCKFSLHAPKPTRQANNPKDEESRPSAGKILARWRPHVIEQSQPDQQQAQQASLVSRPAAANEASA